MVEGRLIEDAAKIILAAKHVTAFTGAGISVESGIPPFRGENGLWNSYDPTFLDIRYFLEHTEDSWVKIKEIFYDYFGKASPNGAHFALAKMESSAILQTIITQNIDHLHQAAGSSNVLEFHGSSKELICMECSKEYQAQEINLNILSPRCKVCGGVLKPNFIFFGEAIPEPANTLSFNEAHKADVFLVIGSTGEIAPASMIPPLAKRNGAKIIEINIEPSSYTNTITDIFLNGKAVAVMEQLLKELGK
jgi:NAD-dependent deacetylase